jgi:Na+-transporting NADH:ubiquinone oxidoreductase subunit NqrF
MSRMRKNIPKSPCPVCGGEPCTHCTNGGIEGECCSVCGGDGSCSSCRAKENEQYKENK